MVALRPRRLARCSPSSRAQHARRCGAARGACEGMAAAKLSCHPSRGVWVCFWCKMRSEQWPAVCTPAPLCKIAARSLQDAACCGVSRGSRWACAPLLGLRGRWDVHLVQLWPAPRARWAARSHSPAPRQGADGQVAGRLGVGVETGSKRVYIIDMFSRFLSLRASFLTTRTRDLAGAGRGNPGCAHTTRDIAGAGGNPGCAHTTRNASVVSVCGTRVCAAC